MINSFSKFLVEEEKQVFFTFGRMNPPTIGHEKLLDKLAQNSRGSSYRVYLSQKQDNKKNPLQYAEKVKIARKMFPRHARSIMLNKKVKTIFEALTTIYNEGFANINMVVGSDRVSEFDILINRYNGKKGKHGFYNFRKINVISAGQRDPDAEGSSGASATKQREAAKSNDFTTFAQGLPKKVSNADAKRIFNSVRKGLGLKEQKEFKNHVQLEPVSNVREAYVSGNLYKEGDQVVIKETTQIATVSQLGTNYIIVEANDMKFRKWLEDVEPLDEDYYKGLSKSTADKRKAHFKKHGAKPDDQKSAYKPAPGDARAKTKLSKHTLKYRRMFGDAVEDVEMAKRRIDREKAADKIKHDRLMDRARMRDVRKKNRETK